MAILTTISRVGSVPLKDEDLWSGDLPHVPRVGETVRVVEGGPTERVAANWIVRKVKWSVGGTTYGGRDEQPDVTLYVDPEEA